MELRQSEAAGCWELQGLRRTRRASGDCSVSSSCSFTSWSLSVLSNKLTWFVMGKADSLWSREQRVWGHFGPQWNCCAWVNSPLLQNKLGVCAGLRYGSPTGLLMIGTLCNLQALNPAAHMSIFLEWIFWLLAFWKWGILLPPSASFIIHLDIFQKVRWDGGAGEKGMCVCVCARTRVLAIERKKPRKKVKDVA